MRIDGHRVCGEKVETLLVGIEVCGTDRPKEPQISDGAKVGESRISEVDD